MLGGMEKLQEGLAQRPSSGPLKGNLVLGRRGAGGVTFKSVSRPLCLSPTLSQDWGGALLGLTMSRTEEEVVTW